MKYNIFGQRGDSLDLVGRFLETQLYHINYDDIIKKKKEEGKSYNEIKKDPKKFNRT